MRLGFTLPQLGSGIGPETVARCAKRAEDLGFDSLWVIERILWQSSPPPPIRSAMALCRSSIRMCSILWRS
jgi:alkanesulfonate monooxygenase SsuD/methylene tetrahydromethanopterin reductase-like flavin-dependent oxidoreductase (luciferase family)